MLCCVNHTPRYCLWHDHFCPLWSFKHTLQPEEGSHGGSRGWSGLPSVVGRAKLDYDKLLTLVTEVEMIINSPPLSYVTPDEPLILREPWAFQIASAVSRIGMMTSKSLSHSWAKEWDSVLNHFWRRWRGEYLLELWESHHYSLSDTHTTTVSVGDSFGSWRRSSIPGPGQSRSCNWKGRPQLRSHYPDTRKESF